jgi:hypothetical protein
MATLVLRGLGRCLGLGVKCDVQWLAECGAGRSAAGCAVAVCL